MRADNDVLGPPCHPSSDKETKRRKMGEVVGGGVQVMGLFQV